MTTTGLLHWMKLIFQNEYKEQNVCRPDQLQPKTAAHHSVLHHNTMKATTTQAAPKSHVVILLVPADT